MELIAVGNGAVQSPTTDCTSFLIGTDNGSLLLDCGPGTVGKLITHSVSLASINTILVSHQHGDHIAEFAYLAFMINRSLRANDEHGRLTVVALPTVHAILRQMLSAQYPSPAITHLDIDHVDVAEGSCTNTDTPQATISSVPVSHTVPTIGALVRIGSKTIAYSADTELSDAFIRLASGSSAMLHQAICPERFSQIARLGKHSTALDAGTAAARAETGALLLFHPLPESMIYQEEMLDQAASKFEGLVAMPAAGGRLTL